ncbi:MAG TPA: DinB family protein [Bryobacteraceae bacterium]|nr:DinB family protein [Bryobacteraceae bacterium]
MNEIYRIRDQMRRAFEGDAWHGPSLREVLEGVDAESAARRPLAGVHSIWEIVLHVSAWKTALCRRIEGSAIELAGEEDWPPVHAGGEAAWKQTLAELAERHRALYGLTARMSDSRLLDPVPGKDHDVYFMLHGAVQHDIYHAGQIAVLRKA